VVVPGQSTTTTAATTSTSAPTPTTAPAAPSSSSGSSDAWIWLLVALVLAGGAAGAYLLWRRRRSRERAAAAWRDELAHAYADARTTSDVLHASATGPIDGARLDALRSEAVATAAALGALSTRAPDDQARTLTKTAEEALHSYLLAIEAEQLVRDQPAPSDDALADANVTRRARGEDLDRALAALDGLVNPPTT
jgi:hypothetical protein